MDQKLDLEEAFQHQGRVSTSQAIACSRTNNIPWQDLWAVFLWTEASKHPCARP